MKFQLALATVATLGSATLTQTKARQDDFDPDCYSDWTWEECSQLYYQYDLCTEEEGWWYSYADTTDIWDDDWWVSAEEFEGWEECNGVADDDECYGEWTWEECSQLYYQEDFCKEELGWWYSHEDTVGDWDDDWWVTAEEFADWEYCQVDDDIDWDDYCYSDWIWEECSQLYYLIDFCTEEYGWWYSETDTLDIWDDDVWWVTEADFDEWEYCQDEGEPVEEPVEEPAEKLESNYCGNEWVTSAAGN